MCSYRDQFIQLWHATLDIAQVDMVETSWGLIYRLFKNEFHLEPYLLNIQSIALRVAMTRLRVGCQNLEIEVGRYHKPRPLPVSERHCHTCKDVEDEKHVMCICTRYEKLRSDLEEKIKFYYCGLSTEQRFVFMMAPTHQDIQNAVAHYIYNALSLRIHNYWLMPHWLFVLYYMLASTALCAKRR